MISSISITRMIFYLKNIKKNYSISDWVNSNARYCYKFYPDSTVDMKFVDFREKVGKAENLSGAN
jgi:hypothetical protein